MFCARKAYTFSNNGSALLPCLAQLYDSYPREQGCVCSDTCLLLLRSPKRSVTVSAPCPTPVLCAETRVGFPGNIINETETGPSRARAAACCHAPHFLPLPSYGAPPLSTVSPKSERSSSRVSLNSNYLFRSPPLPPSPPPPLPPALSRPWQSPWRRATEGGQVASLRRIGPLIDSRDSRGHSMPFCIMLCDSRARAGEEQAARCKQQGCTNI